MKLINVKLCLYMLIYHTIKAHKGVEVLLDVYLTLDTKWDARDKLHVPTVVTGNKL
jgi:hypothetical protein